MTGKYILDGHKVIRCDDIFVWAKSVEKNKRRVALTNGFRVQGLYCFPWARSLIRLWASLTF